MKKLKLLFAVLALLVGGANSTSAQTDVTSTYITKADLSSTDGWTEYVSAGYKDLGNGLIGTYGVRTAEKQAVSTVDGTHLATEYCFGFEARWNTNYAAYQQTITLPAGNYLFAYDVENTNSATSYSNSYNNLFYVQVGETKYEDTSVEWMMGQRSWTKHIISFSLASESSVTISLGYGTGDNNFGAANTPTLHVSHLELIYSASNPLDYTSKIANNSFESGDTGWTHGSSSDTGVKDNSGNYATTGTDGNKLFNTWWQGVPITQEIADVPNGKYVIKAALASSDAEVNAKLFLLGPTASEHSNVIDIYKGTSGVFHDYAFEVLVTSKSITLGAVGGNDAGEYVPGGHWWYKADNFRLYYLGEDLSMYETPFANAQTYAKGINQSAPMNATVLSTLQSAISDYGDKAFSTFESSDDITAAIDALNNAADAATTSISNYEGANDAITKAEALQTANNFVTSEAATTFAEAIAAIKTPYTNRTLTDENAAAAGRTLGVVAVGWHPDATNTQASNYMGSTWPSTYTINDWSVEGESDGSNYVVPFFQNWTNDDKSLGTTTMTGTLTGLSAGIYKVSAWVRVRAKNGVAATNATGITMDVNGGTAVDVTEGTQVGETQFQLKVYEATGIVSEDGNLTVNFNIADGNNISWLSYRDISYTRLGDASVSATITSAGWATFSSDYALDFSKATTGLEAYMITGHEGNLVTKSKVTGTVPAGTGLLLKGDAGNYIIPVVASSETNVVANLMKAGTGAEVSAEAGKTKYVLGVNGEEAEFQKITDTPATVAKGKAYLQFDEVISGARALRISFDDITGVENVEAAAEAKAQDGKFIENGKIVIVKNGKKFNANGQQVK